MQRLSLCMHFFHRGKIFSIFMKYFFSPSIFLALIICSFYFLIFIYTCKIIAICQKSRLSKEDQIEIRQNKYLNNRIEGDHRFIKKRTRPMLGFKSFRSAARTIAGIELLHMIKKGQLADNDNYNSDFDEHSMGQDPWYHCRAIAWVQAQLAS